MFKRPLIFALLILVAGCSQDPMANQAGSAGDAAATLPADANAPGATPLGRSRHGFAALPDRGDLVAYPARPVVRRDGAFTWHQVDLSEAHALRAIETGKMVITAPDGQPIRLQYSRHVEHPDGNWTWIGRDAHGADAVLTFGEKAAFGSIPYGEDEQLKLTVAGGRSWLVATERSQRASVDALPRAGGDDFLVPPKLAVAAARQKITAASQAAELAGAGEVATVDVVLGYTTGFAAKLGGASQARTRLNNLVEITNQAYTNSGITAQARLVHVVEVNYPDATKNEDALRQLTGYGSGITAPDPAFAALRAARDQYGADLVSLVRKFQTPENDGCGIAWLIGGKQSGMDAGDAPFGYSVVSDGQDMNESDGKNYHCREETLAHELGHNMGQAHNIEDASGAGLHSYSYGYREASTSGFYTVMAYRLADSQQFTIRYFSNPDVLYAGRPTGTSEANNALSLRQSAPIIAGFRPTVVAPTTPARPVVGDFNGDGKADVALRNGSQFSYWLMDGATILSKVAGIDGGAGYQAKLVADFTGDGRADVLFLNSSDRNMKLWNSPVGGSAQFTNIGKHALGWELFAAADVNSDGKADLLFRNGTLHAHWLMDGARVIAGVIVGGAGGRYVTTQVADFNGDARAEVLYEDTETHNMWLWFTHTGTVQPVEIGTNLPGWELYTTADANADGKADLVFRNGSQLAFWLMDGNRVTNGILFGTAPAGYSLAATADYNGDGRVEFLFADASSQLLLWTIAADYSLTARSLGSAGPGWAPIPLRF